MKSPSENKSSNSESNQPNHQVNWKSYYRNSHFFYLKRLNLTQPRNNFNWKKKDFSVEEDDKYKDYLGVKGFGFELKF